MSERAQGPEGREATHAADSHLAERKARTAKWLRRGFSGVATSFVTFVGGIITGPFIPPVGAGLIAVSLGAALYGAGSMAIGIGSGIGNTIRRF